MKTKYKNLIVFTTYSLGLIPLWGLGLLQIDIANSITTVITFLITAYSLLFLKRKFAVNNFILLLGPSFYMLATIFVRGYEELIFFPITWIYVMYILLLFTCSMKSAFSHLAIFVFTLGFILSPYLEEESDEFSSFTKQYETVKQPNLLYTYDLINSVGDTVHLKGNGKPYLVETWNESCRPCIRSILEMQDSINKSTFFKHIYLYQAGSGKSLNLDSIFNFKFIKDKSKIYIDVENKLLNDMGLNSYPFFIVFNSDGQMQKYFSGYRSEYRDQILQTLFSSLKKSDDGIRSKENKR